MKLKSIAIILLFTTINTPAIAHKVGDKLSQTIQTGGKPVDPQFYTGGKPVDPPFTISGKPVVPAFTTGGKPVEPPAPL
ncbi:hypothetical protein [Alteromonas sp. a30]|uniref:hypothetical protein n=1 Tax=Alteromonas sp. a30 TaxID=2730917 RepID=UPI002282ECB0|nr:hypothetical protein [Alteromonas sp. a30]MCY7297292.1 hypothetical protein [Alteromonas sp. a30]